MCVTHDPSLLLLRHMYAYRQPLSSCLRNERSSHGLNKLLVSNVLSFAHEESQCELPCMYKTFSQSTSMWHSSRALPCPPHSLGTFLGLPVAHLIVEFHDGGICCAARAVPFSQSIENDKQLPQQLRDATDTIAVPVYPQEMLAPCPSIVRNVGTGRESSLDRSEVMIYSYLHIDYALP